MCKRQWLLLDQLELSVYNPVREGWLRETFLQAAPAFSYGGRDMRVETKNRIEAGAEIAFGTAKIISGALMATGHGLIGSYLKSHHHMRTAAVYGSRGIKSGVEHIKSGVDQWKRRS
jgi:hypothetical protein